jgi:hypothetical protein
VPQGDGVEGTGEYGYSFHCVGLKNGAKLGFRHDLTQIFR